MNRGPVASSDVRAVARARLFRAQRLASDQVSAVLKSGRLVRASRLWVYRLPNALPYPRLALVVPKRHVPRAVGRNRIRRIVREAFRLNRHALGCADFVVRLAKPPGLEPIVVDEVAALLRKGGD